MSFKTETALLHC